MPRRGRGTTTQAGYGARHRRNRRRLLAAHVDGNPCALCGLPMYRSQDLHADHSDPRALNADSDADRLVHGSCNTSRGARLGNRLRARRRPLPDAVPVPRRLPEW
ncbi:hypothetical protein Psed_5784 [Pseudonocardia dioxanivorans CB1190]|uniref:HNH endonuclease n=1 Tax=Pseudonocardia dioxanivorans (strain ATCC 55486 / DSM 44775 / JCM 13855 / CB1190) TaxID=675635 RepID=F4D1C3_PSEUX|nr:hypothetical protein [Pseudonocardia dioxanivorans]AEA27911.1 hypothetical protein Psed_5784 [Pseudonocardia dioxanivorans CB1190]